MKSINHFFKSKTFYTLLFLLFVLNLNIADSASSSFPVDATVTSQELISIDGKETVIVEWAEDWSNNGDLNRLSQERIDNEVLGRENSRTPKLGYLIQNYSMDGIGVIDPVIREFDYTEYFSGEHIGGLKYSMKVMIPSSVLSDGSYTFFMKKYNNDTNRFESNPRQINSSIRILNSTNKTVKMWQYIPQFISPDFKIPLHWDFTGIFNFDIGIKALPRGANNFSLTHIIKEDFPSEYQNYYLEFPKDFDPKSQLHIAFLSKDGSIMTMSQMFSVDVCKNIPSFQEKILPMHELKDYECVQSSRYDSREDFRQDYTAPRNLKDLSVTASAAPSGYRYLDDEWQFIDIKARVTKPKNNNVNYLKAILVEKVGSQKNKIVSSHAMYPYTLDDQRGYSEAYNHKLYTAEDSSGEASVWSYQMFEKEIGVENTITEYLRPGTYELHVEGYENNIATYYGSVVINVDSPSNNNSGFVIDKADLCINIPGVQLSVPLDKKIQNNKCVNTVNKFTGYTKPDLCHNIEGNQFEMPVGYSYQMGKCVLDDYVTHPADMCSNIAGIQTPDDIGVILIIDDPRYNSVFKSGRYTRRDDGTCRISYIGTLDPETPIASTCPVFGSNMTLGSRGAEVSRLQNFLIGEGYTIQSGATGYFGSQTQAALAGWQAANGVVPADGYFGPISRSAISSVCMGDDTSDSSVGGPSTGTINLSLVTDRVFLYRDLGNDLEIRYTSTNIPPQNGVVEFIGGAVVEGGYSNLMKKVNFNFEGENEGVITLERDKRTSRGGIKDLLDSDIISFNYKIILEDGTESDTGIFFIGYGDGTCTGCVTDDPSDVPVEPEPVETQVCEIRLGSTWREVTCDSRLFQSFNNNLKRISIIGTNPPAPEPETPSTPDVPSTNPPTPETPSTPDVPSTNPPAPEPETPEDDQSETKSCEIYRVLKREWMEVDCDSRLYEILPDQYRREVSINNSRTNSVYASYDNTYDVRDVIIWGILADLNK